MADSAPALVSELKRVLFPTFGSPTIPNFIYIHISFIFNDFSRLGTFVLMLESPGSFFKAFGINRLSTEMKSFPKGRKHEFITTLYSTIKMLIFQYPLKFLVCTDTNNLKIFSSK